MPSQWNITILGLFAVSTTPMHPIHYIQFPTIQVYPKQLSQLHLNRAYNRLHEMRQS